MVLHAPAFLPSPLRRFLQSEAVAGLLLMACAAAALVVSNGPAASLYAATLARPIGPLPVLHWINDGAMALFFLLVGCEIKREVLHGHLRTWRSRALPGLCAAGGMVCPALIYAALNVGRPSLRGWAVPSATDIAFALGVIAMLGPRVPARLKITLTALAVLDDLGAVAIIAGVYAGDLSWPMLGGAAAVVAACAALNAAGVRSLAPYLGLGAVLWVLVYRSGVHATVAGVLLAMTVPADAGLGRPSPLDRLEAMLSGPVAFVILPLFGFANAGVALAGGGSGLFTRPVVLGVAGGLFVGKQAGVMGSAWLAIRSGLARRPAGSGWLHLYGMALLCGVGFTMSLFMGELAFSRTPESLDDTKLGVLMGSLLSAGAGTLVLSMARPAGQSVSRQRD